MSLRDCYNRLVTIPNQPYSKETNTNRWRHNSGYIMLARAVVDKTVHYPDIIWEEKDYTLLKKVKKSIVGNKNTPHFGASGKYFSFGMNGFYKIDEKQSSVGIYSNKKGKDDEHKKKIEEISNCLEEKLQASLQRAVSSQSHLFLHCSNFLSPVMDVANRMQDDHGDINLSSGKLEGTGLYSAQVCINATTRDFRTEFDQ